MKAASSQLALDLSASTATTLPAFAGSLPVVGRRTRLRRILVLALFVFGLIVCVTSLCSILLLPAFVSNQISKRLVLKNNSLLLERWSKPNVPMYFKVWLFDVKNAREVLEQRGIKPKLEEVGPFVFHLKRHKDVISFAGDNLYYTERKLYHFSPELSCCSINTTVTVPNIPLVAVVDRALSFNLPLLSRFIPRLINRAIQSLREQLFVKRQVRELLFDGYEVELLKMVSRVSSLLGMPQTTQQRFAILKGRNDSWRPEQDGVWAINTGISDRRQFGKVSSWNSYKQLPFWNGVGCNAINGSDGTLFPPPISKEQPLYIFNQELCRTVNLIYSRPSDIRAIQAYRFVLNPLNFARTMAPSEPSSSPSSAPLSSPSSSASSSASAAHRRGSRNKTDKEQLVASEQAKLVTQAQEAQAISDRRKQSPKNPQSCFCDRKGSHLNGANVCEFDGLIDLSKCTKQAQVIFGSMPHFYQSDPRLARQVEGMEPNASKHTTYLDIEPNTGLVLGGKRRVQLNLIIKHNKEVDGFENINDMLIPLVWFEESALIPEESARKFKALYTDRIRLVNVVLISLFVAALGLLAVDLRLLLQNERNLNLKRFNVINRATAAAAAASSSAGGSEQNVAQTGNANKQPNSPLANKVFRLAGGVSGGHANPLIGSAQVSSPSNGRQDRLIDKPLLGAEESFGSESQQESAPTSDQAERIASSAAAQAQISRLLAESPQQQ